MRRTLDKRALTRRSVRRGRGLSDWLRTSRTGCSGAAALVGLLSAALPLRDGARHPEMGSDVPHEQRLQGFDPLRCTDGVALIAATSPSQRKGQMSARTNVGSADGFTDSRPKGSDLRTRHRVARFGHVFGKIKLLAPRGSAAYAPHSHSDCIDRRLRVWRLCCLSLRLATQRASVFQCLRSRIGGKL